MTQKPVTAWMIAGLLCLSADHAQAATPNRFSGAISGFVFDAAGIPQLGASVSLFNQQDQLFLKALTDNRGAFQFPGLLPEVYSIKVTFATFVPAIRKNILVQPGMRSVLNVNLNTLFSSIQFAYPPIENGSIMSDEWKWVLRSASPTRPVLRFTPDALARDTRTSSSRRSAVFSDTRGVLKVSAGEGPVSSVIGNEADLGTAFALATSLYGNNMLQVSGNLGYGSQTGVPSAGIRTSYSRNIGGGTPEVSLTMRQLFVPGRLGAALGGNATALPMLRSMSASFDDSTELAEGLTAQYGFTMTAVTFMDRLTYASPYARLAYKAGKSGEIEIAYTSGDARPNLAGQGQDEDFQQDLNSLALFPRVSLRNGRPRIQRGQNIQVGYTRKGRSRTYQFTVFRESISNAALSIVAPNGLYSSSDVLPDLFTGASTFNAGDFRSTGYTASVTQNLGDHVAATLIYGSMGALSAGAPGEIVSNSPDELRAMIHAGRRRAATVRLAATAPWTGTHMIASYQWTDPRVAMPGHMYSIQAMRPMPGLNVLIRQPIPTLGNLPWRMELTADLRNLLAQGYLPLGTLDGQQVMLIQTPRSFRGGLSFVF